MGSYPVNSAGLNACPKELNTISRVPVRARSPLMARARVKPSISGICTSKSARWYGWQPRLRFAGGTARLDPPRPKLMAQDSTVGVVVIDRQHAESGQITATEWRRRPAFPVAL
jgi:hypothetical protein